MGRARRARRIAAAAAFGGGGAGAVGLGSYALLAAQARIARKVVGRPFEDSPDDSGTYGHGHGEPVVLLVVGDSTARGMGVQRPDQTVGATVATGVAAFTGRPVDLVNAAVVGAVSADLPAQLERARQRAPQPDVAVVMVGANDVTHRVERAAAVRHLAQTVRRLRESGAEVVVGTCPDLGTVRPVPQPLRLVLRRLARDLAAAQTVAVVEQGGRTVSLGDLLGPSFSSDPAVMFSIDRFHPSPAGYARAAAAILPSVLDALGLRPGEPLPAPDRRRGETVGPVSVAARRAVADPGTEVSGTDTVGRRGRWAVLRRRPAAASPVGRDEASPGPGSTTTAAGVSGRSPAD